MATPGGAGERMTMRATLTNANPHPVKLRLTLAGAGDARIEGVKGVRLKDGAQIVELTVPANGARSAGWTLVSL